MMKRWLASGFLLFSCLTAWAQRDIDIRLTGIPFGHPRQAVITTDEPNSAPTTLLFDRDGRLVEIAVGGMTFLYDWREDGEVRVELLQGSSGHHVSYSYLYVSKNTPSLIQFDYGITTITAEFDAKGQQVKYTEEQLGLEHIHRFINKENERIIQCSNNPEHETRLLILERDRFNNPVTIQNTMGAKTITTRCEIEYWE